ncbi:MAG: SWF/SNF helicase family protein [Saprospiraceae bacterium]|nr:SWF/SNF helicase family protein [Saprospiraceae bacterium]
MKHLEIYESYLKTEGLSYSKLTGEDSQNDRKNAVEKFNEDPECKVFLMSIKAGGVGLNLTAASYVLILDPWWNPFVERQAVARAHRMGQQNKVTVIRFIAKDSIEEKILKLQVEKLHMAEQFVDVGDIPTLDKTDLTYLLN